MILAKVKANLALAKSVNYYRKVNCQLKYTFTKANYNYETFIVQATGVIVIKSFMS